MPSSSLTTSVSRYSGRKAWEAVKHCVILKEQHRFPTSGGLDDDQELRSLYSVVKLLSQEGEVDLDTCTRLCERLNSRAMEPAAMAAMLKRVPRAVVLRHKVRSPLNKLLVKNHAKVLNTQVIAWRCVDRASNGRALSPQVLRSLDGLPCNQTGDMPAMQYFFPGVLYIFNDNHAPHVNWTNNTTCVGHSIVVHPDEPAFAAGNDLHVLRYPPLAVMVCPEGLTMASMSPGLLVDNCVPVMQATASFTVRFPEPMVMYKDAADNTPREYTISIKRVGIPLDHAMAVTDFYAQGVSFKKDPFFCHINPPPDSSIRRANILVPVSRPSLWDALHLVAPLWPKGDVQERKRVIQAFMRAVKPRPEYVKEMARLHDLASATWAELGDRYGLGSLA